MFKVSEIKDVPQEIVNSFFVLTDKALQNQVEITPMDARHHLLYASFLSRYNKYDDAILHYEKALELSPKKQAIYFGLVSVYFNKGEKEKAFELAKVAFDLDNKYSKARDIYLSIATDTGRDDLVVSVLQKYTEENIDDLQARLSLAVAYLNINERQKAIKEIESVIEIEPEFKEQGQYYINEIKAGRNP